MFSKNNRIQLERRQERIDAGFMSKHFPGVVSILINMVYRQKGAGSLQRTLSFAPGSYAFFKVTCLSNDCVDGGFDLTHVITSMIDNHSEVSKGELVCDDSGPRTGHSNIAYEITIQYT